MNIENFIENLDIHEGDLLLMTGNLIKLIKKVKRQDKQFDLNVFIDLILQKLTPSGTLVIQTFNWDFCEGKTYDILNSQSRTGSLGTVALKREDFQRTKHPIYSFAVAGKFQKELTNLKNIGAFDSNSPFNFMYLNNAKMIIIGLPLQNSFTFVHYVEEVNQVPYRYNKTFQANYIDYDGVTHIKEYDMYVRNLEQKILTSIQPLEKIFVDQGVMLISNYEEIDIKRIDLVKSYNVIVNDIQNNKAKNLYTIGE